MVGTVLFTINQLDVVVHGAATPDVKRRASALRVSDHGDMEIRPGVDVDDEALAAFATRHLVRRLAAFGSVLRNDFGPDSDIDVLVEFQPGQAPGLVGLAAMELELGALIGREVELRTYFDLSRFFRDKVRESARELYAA